VNFSKIIAKYVKILAKLVNSRRNAPKVGKRDEKSNIPEPQIRVPQKSRKSRWSRDGRVMVAVVVVMVATVAVDGRDGRGRWSRWSWWSRRWSRDGRVMVAAVAAVVCGPGPSVISLLVFWSQDVLRFVVSLMIYA